MVSALHRNFTARHFKNTLNLNSPKIRDLLKLAPLRHYVCFISLYHASALFSTSTSDSCLSSSSKMTNSPSVAPGISGNSVEAEDGEVPFKLRIASPSPTAARKTFEINPSLWCHENADYLSCRVLAHVAKSREKLRPLKPILTILLQILSTSCSSKTTAHSQGRGPTKQENLGSCCIEVTLGVQLIKERLLQMRDHRSSAAKRILFCGSRGKQMRQGSFFW